jgi:hypothetical protein
MEKAGITYKKQLINTMKKLLLVTTILAIAPVLVAQLPKGPDGKDLYQNEDCKTILQNVKYKCAFSEDAALTKNCKEYDCSLTECKESKNIKETSGKEFSKPIDIQGKQIRMRQDSSKPSNHVDITNLLSERKVQNGKVVIYESEGKYKVYAVYKKGKLVEWYGTDEAGAKIKPSQLGITPTSCEDCIVLPSGMMVCKKCTTSTGVNMPIKKAE